MRNRSRLFLFIFISSLVVLPSSILLYAEDCNGNGVDDLIDISMGTSEDCNENSIQDECDINQLFAGTQGGQNHRKTDRMITVSQDGLMPMVLFAEGGGGRPGDTDGLGGEGTTTFARFAQLSGLVPMVGIT